MITVVPWDTANLGKVEHILTLAPPVFVQMRNLGLQKPIHNSAPAATLQWFLDLNKGLWSQTNFYRILRVSFDNSGIITVEFFNGKVNFIT